MNLKKIIKKTVFFLNILLPEIRYLVLREEINDHISFTANTQVRFVHSDVKVPDFSHYRRAESADPNKKNDSYESRNGFSYMIAGGKRYFNMKKIIPELHVRFFS